MKKLLLSLIFATNVIAVPQLLNYQGQLTRPNGTPLDTTVTMTFYVWPTPAGGIADWTETHSAVIVMDGLFKVLLGSVAPPLPDLFAANRWLGISVGDDPEMTPREQLVSVAHAYRVGTVDGSGGGRILSDLTVDGRLVVGSLNSATGDFASVTGGEQNDADGQLAIVSGGSQNSAAGLSSVVGGGFANTAANTYSVVDGGNQNFSMGIASVVGGGSNNRARASYSTVGGGGGNTISDSNSAIGQFSTVSGGRRNRATFTYATVGGGDGNSASGEYSVISGGEDHTATAMYSTIGGGYDNNASGVGATISGGFRNTASGDHSFAAGSNVSALGNYSTVLGAHASCSADSAFAWSDGSGPLFSIGSDNTFNLKANAGFRFWTTANHADNIGARLAAGGTSWVSLSDSTKKTNRQKVNTAEVIQKIAALPLDQWNYKHQADGPLHIGPMAQDFWNAFHLGSDSLGIETMDADGVLFAAVQELAKRVHDLTKQNRVQQLQIQSLQAEQQQSTIITKK